MVNRLPGGRRGRIVERASARYGATHARVIVSLLIPLLGIWLNRVEDGVLQIESFEFANLIVGGLVAVIALNFTVNSTYQVLGSGDNPVSRLFALNYVLLGVSLMVNVLLFRFNMVGCWFGRYVQEQLYLFLVWAVPLLVLITAASVILGAMVWPQSGKSSRSKRCRRSGEGPCRLA